MEEPVEYRARLIGDALRHQTLIIVLAVLLGSLLGYGASIARPGSYVGHGDGAHQPAVRQPLLAPA